MRILFVENHAVFAQQVSEQFLSEHSITVVPSLERARQKLQRHSFDLVLVNYDLDDGKGVELIEDIKKSISTIKIIAASSHDAGNAALEEAGADAVCEKMKFEQIQKVIDGLREGSK